MIFLEFFAIPTFISLLLQICTSMTKIYSNAPTFISNTT